MRILFDNVNPGSSTGPNTFGRKLMNELQRKGHEASVDVRHPDIQLSFIISTKNSARKLGLRLDGIYFNTKQDWQSMNVPIKTSYDAADFIIHQTNFNKRLTEKYFGPSKSSFVIHNGTCLSEVSQIEAITHPKLDSFEELWCCSSSWRPHKRLKENIRYFLETKPKNAGLVVLGDNPDFMTSESSVMYVGKQPWETCISIYKRCKKFIHLAFLDHCPNVVVDARASGCDIVVSSSGGTREIAGPHADVIQDVDWDLRPLDLYTPPTLNFAEVFTNNLESNIDISSVASKYIEAFENSTQG